MRLPEPTWAELSSLAAELGITESELIARMLKLTNTARALIWLSHPLGRNATRPSAEESA